jgi:hypothetical protein
MALGSMPGCANGYLLASLPARWAERGIAIELYGAPSST